MSADRYVGAIEASDWCTRITVIEFGMNDGGGSGTCCGGIKVRTDTTKLSNVVIASFGDG